MATAMRFVVGLDTGNSDLTPALGWNKFIWSTPASDQGTFGATVTRAIPGTTTDEISGSFSLEVTKATFASSPIATSPWPAGTYTAQIQANTVPAGASYKIQLLHVSSTGTVIDTFGTSSAFTDTGAHTFSAVVTPTAANAGDRIQVRILGSNNTGSPKTIIFGNESIGYVEGPWAPGAINIIYPGPATGNNPGWQSAGPFKLGSNYYMIYGYGLNLIAYVSTDPDPGIKSQWTMQDSLQFLPQAITAGAIDGQIYGIRAAQNGNTLHIGFWFATISGGNGRFYYYTSFDSSSFGSLESVATGNVNDPLAPARPITRFATDYRPSDGHVIISWSEVFGFPSTNQRVRYSERTAVNTWTAAATVNASTDAQLVGTVMGAGSRLHFHYYDVTNNHLNHRSLSSGGALDTEVALATDAFVSTNPSEYISPGLLNGSNVVLVYATNDNAYRLPYPDQANPTAGALTPNIFYYSYPQMVLFNGDEYIFSNSSGTPYFSVLGVAPDVTGCPQALDYSGLTPSVNFFTTEYTHDVPVFAFSIIPIYNGASPYDTLGVGPLYWEMVIPLTGTIEIVKNTLRGNTTFDFTVAGLSPSTPSVTTVAGTGTTGAVSVLAGTYDVSETVPAGWMLRTASAVGSSTDDGSFAGDTISGIEVNIGDAVVATFADTFREPQKIFKCIDLQIASILRGDLTC